MISTIIIDSSPGVDPNLCDSRNAAVCANPPVGLGGTNIDGGDGRPSKPGCVEYVDRVSMDYDTTYVEDVKIHYEQCGGELQKALAAQPSLFKADAAQVGGADTESTQVAVMVGGVAKVDLPSGTFEGVIEPVAVGEQLIERPGDTGSWSWEIKPNKPGDVVLNLVVSIMPQGSDEAVVLMNERLPITVHVRDSLGYTITHAWNNVIAFVASLSGALSVAGAAAVAIGAKPFWGWVKRRRTGKGIDQAQAGSKSESRHLLPPLHDDYYDQQR